MVISMDQISVIPAKPVPAKAGCGIHQEKPSGEFFIRKMEKALLVIPAEAGIQGNNPYSLDSGSPLRYVRNDEISGCVPTTDAADVIPAKAYSPLSTRNFVIPAKLVPAKAGAGIHQEKTSGKPFMQKTGKAPIVIPAKPVPAKAGSGIQGNNPYSLDSGSPLRYVRNDEISGCVPTTDAADVIPAKAYSPLSTRNFVIPAKLVPAKAGAGIHQEKTSGKPYMQYTGKAHYVIPAKPVPAKAGSGIQCVNPAQSGITQE